MTTSRVGRKPVTVPKGIDVKIQGADVLIKGPKSQTTVTLHPMVQVELDGSSLKVIENINSGYCRSGSGARLKKSIVGTTRANLANVITGLANGFESKLVLVGVGYKAQAKGKILSLAMGFSHPVDFPVPEG